MSTSCGSRDYGRFDELAEEFAERYRRGERPSLQEYVDRLPEMAEEIREMFPALVEVEQAEGDARGDGVPPPSPVARHLGRVGRHDQQARWGRDEMVSGFPGLGSASVTAGCARVLSELI